MHNIARGSIITADVYLRRLGNFCINNNIKPKDLIKMKKIDELLMDMVTNMESKGYAGSYIESVIKALKSWLAYNNIELKKKIKINNARDTVNDKSVPTKDELKKILLASDMKARVASILIAHSGLRLETLGNYKGTDGLRIRDFPEMVIGNEIRFEKIPTMIIIRKELSKARHQYFTFLSNEGCKYLKDYLEFRIRNGENLDEDSSIIAPKSASKQFITTTNIGDIIRKAVRASGFRWRPYVLRSYFDTQLMLAESKGLILRDYRQFFMGHKGDIEARYTTNNKRLPDDVIEDMRNSYARAEEYLQTEKDKDYKDKIKEEFKKQLMLVAGFKEEEIEDMDLASISNEEFQEMIRKKLIGLMSDNGNKQKIVTLDDIEHYINQGWEFVATINDNKAIVKLPF